MIKNVLGAIALMLLALSAFAQIPEGYYNGTENLSGDALKSVLHEIINDHQEYSYNDLRDFILSDTDEDPDNSNNIILLYTGRSQAKSTFGGGANDWNREHVWAKSHGDFGTTPPCGTDAHHLRPTDASVNSSRGNLDFDNGGVYHSEATGCRYDSDSWEPRDEVKGDVARMIFYMAVRYEGDNGEPDLEVVDEVNTYPAPEHGKLSALLEWNELDPPDDFENHRNDVIYSYQNNRNPFIDHPEFVAKIFGPSAGTETYTQNTLKCWYAAGNVSYVMETKGSSDYEIQLMDISGRLVETWSATTESGVFHTGELNSGLYIITVSNNGAYYTGSKMMVF